MKRERKKKNIVKTHGIVSMHKMQMLNSQFKHTDYGYLYCFRGEIKMHLKTLYLPINLQNEMLRFNEKFSR